MAKTQRSVQYRYLERERAEFKDETLEQAVRKALSLKGRKGWIIGKDARARIADLAQEGQLTLWNGMKGHTAKEGVLQGELVLYKRGFNQTAIEEQLDSESERFKMVTFETDGKSKPVEGALYFAILGDHVGLIQSNAVTSRWLERYLTWLLKDATSIIEKEAVVNLSSRLTVGEQSIGRLGPAQSLQLSAKPSTGPKADRALREKAKGAGATVLEVLQMLGVGSDAIASIEADIPEGGRLEGDFLVYIKDKNRRKEISVGTLDHAFRNTDPADLKIRHKGAKVAGNASVLSEPVRLEQTPHGLDPEEAMTEIVNVLYKWAERSLIDLPPYA